MEKLKSVITTSERLYIKAVTERDLYRLSDLYLYDSYDEFDSVKLAFNSDKTIDKSKLHRIIMDRMEDYKKIKLSDKHKASRYLLYKKDTHECVGMIGFDRMDVPTKEMNPVIDNAFSYDTSRSAIVLIYKIHPFHCRKGYATEGVGSMLEWFFRNISHREIIAKIFKTNLASQRVVQKLGFKKIYEYSFDWDIADEKLPYNALCFGLKKNHLIS